MAVKLTTEQHLKSLILKGGCSGSSESTLAKMPHCRKSHVTAHISLPLLPLIGSFIDKSSKYLYNLLVQCPADRTCNHMCPAKKSQTVNANGLAFVT